MSEQGLVALDDLRATAEEIARDPERAEALEADPRAFLSALGISIDEQSAQSLHAQLAARRLAARTKAIQAGSIHIDIL